MALEPLANKFNDFGWYVQEADGHNVADLLNAFRTPTKNGQPKVILAHTVKGKGVSFLENTTESHFARLKPEQAEKALAELDRAMAEIG